MVARALQFGRLGERASGAFELRGCVAGDFNRLPQQFGRNRLVLGGDSWDSFLKWKWGRRSERLALTTTSTASRGSRNGARVRSVVKGRSPDGGGIGLRQFVFDDVQILVGVLSHGGDAPVATDLNGLPFHGDRDRRSHRTELLARHRTILLDLSTRRSVCRIGLSHVLSTRRNRPG